MQHVMMYGLTALLAQHSPELASPACRYFLLLAFAALLVAAPLVRCQDDDDDVEDTFVDAEETVASPEPSAAGSAGGIADVATEYLNTATELGKQYASQAAEVAQQYLGSYGVSTNSSSSLR
jgi:hypothetical protein